MFTVYSQFFTFGIEDARVRRNTASCVLVRPKPFGHTRTLAENAFKVGIF
jgi:hypothetical protein